MVRPKDGTGCKSALIDFIDMNVPVAEIKYPKGRYTKEAHMSDKLNEAAKRYGIDYVRARYINNRIFLFNYKIPNVLFRAGAHAIMEDGSIYDRQTDLSNSNRPFRKTYSDRQINRRNVRISKSPAEVPGRPDKGKSGEREGGNG